MNKIITSITTIFISLGLSLNALAGDGGGGKHYVLNLTGTGYMYESFVEDIDGDGIDDLIGTWSPTASQGLWVKYSETESWKKISLSLPSDIGAGLFRGGAWDEGKVQ